MDDTGAKSLVACNYTVVLSTCSATCACVGGPSKKEVGGHHAFWNKSGSCSLLDLDFEFSFSFSLPLAPLPIWAQCRALKFGVNRIRTWDVGVGSSALDHLSPFHMQWVPFGPNMYCERSVRTSHNPMRTSTQANIWGGTLKYLCMACKCMPTTFSHCSYLGPEKWRHVHHPSKLGPFFCTPLFSEFSSFGLRHR